MRTTVRGQTGSHALEGSLPSGAMANDLLVTHLGSIDKRLLTYLDDDEDMSLATIDRLRSMTSDLLAGTLTAPELTAQWADWFDLVSAFVVTYGSVELEDLEEEVGFGPDTEADEPGPPTGLLRGYLLSLELELDGYPEMKRSFDR
jgi:hypothetical protein